MPGMRVENADATGAYTQSPMEGDLHVETWITIEPDVSPLPYFKYLLVFFSNKYLAGNSFTLVVRKSTYVVDCVPAFLPCCNENRFQLNTVIRKLNIIKTNF